MKKEGKGKFGQYWAMLGKLGQFCASLGKLGQGKTRQQIRKLEKRGRQNKKRE